MKMYLVTEALALKHLGEIVYTSKMSLYSPRHLQEDVENGYLPEDATVLEIDVVSMGLVADILAGASI